MMWSHTVEPFPLTLEHSPVICFRLSRVGFICVPDWGCLVLQGGWGEVKRVLMLVLRIRFAIEVRGAQRQQMNCWNQIGLDLLPWRAAVLFLFLQRGPLGFRRADGNCFSITWLLSKWAPTINLTQPRIPWKVSSNCLYQVGLWYVCTSLYWLS